MKDMPRSVWYAGISLSLVGLGATIAAGGVIKQDDLEVVFGIFQIFSCSIFFAFQLKRAVRGLD